MTDMKRILPLFLIFCSLAFGQNGEVTSSRLLMIKNLAESSDLDLKETALSELDTFLADSPGEGLRENALEILYFLAGEGVTNITYEGLRPGVTSSAIRAGAAGLIGKYGGEEAVVPLVNIMFYDNDSLSIGAAVSASAVLEAQKKDNIINAYARILKMTRQVYLSESLVQTVLEAIAQMSEAHPEIFDNQELMEGLDLTTQGASGYGRTTRKMAEEILHTAALKKQD